jgi:hypothetical protein
MKDYYGQEVDVGDYVLHQDMSYRDSHAYSTCVSRIERIEGKKAYLDLALIAGYKGQQKITQKFVAKRFLKVDKALFDAFNKSDNYTEHFTPDPDPDDDWDYYYFRPSEGTPTL